MMSHSHVHLSLLIYRLAEACHKVVGVDISETAVKDFFIDNHLSYEKKRIGKLMRYRVSSCNTSSPCTTSNPCKHPFHLAPFLAPQLVISHLPLLNRPRNFSLLFTHPPFSLLCACPWNVPPSSQYLYSLCFNLS